jgi:predicted DNA-binding transcriptional regulator AlpA
MPRNPRPIVKHRPPSPRAKMQRVSDDEPPVQIQPIRFLGKADVTALCNVSYPTIWKWMQQGTFPKGREVGGKTCWRSDEIADWQNKRPVAHVKNGA